MPNCRN
jgi:3-mercaptopyruvate sulfurtransferase SseA